MEKQTRERRPQPNPERPRGWVVYSLSTRFLRDASRALAVGRQFIPNEYDTFRVVETPFERSFDRHEVSGILAGNIEEALDRIGQYLATDGRSGKWELRSLRIPGLYLEALWLHSTIRQSDVVIPYSTFDEDILPNQVYRLTTFLSLAAKAAANRGVQAP